jgi:hypothetical protein
MDDDVIQKLEGKRVRRFWRKMEKQSENERKQCIPGLKIQRRIKGQGPQQVVGEGKEGGGDGAIGKDGGLEGSRQSGIED